MSRYIDADHLRKWILSWWERTEPTSECLKGRDILNQIDRETSIDIVRCAECKRGKPYSDKQLECDALGLGGLKFPDDFCSYGERKESE